MILRIRDFCSNFSVTGNLFLKIIKDFNQVLANWLGSLNNCMAGDKNQYHMAGKLESSVDG